MSSSQAVLLNGAVMQVGASDERRQGTDTLNRTEYLGSGVRSAEYGRSPAYQEFVRNHGRHPITFRDWQEVNKLAQNSLKSVNVG